MLFFTFQPKSTQTSLPKDPNVVSSEQEQEDIAKGLINIQIVLNLFAFHIVVFKESCVIHRGASPQKACGCSTAQTAAQIFIIFSGYVYPKRI